eukprot:RCo048202
MFARVFVCAFAVLAWMSSAPLCAHAVTSPAVVLRGAGSELAGAGIAWKWKQYFEEAYPQFGLTFASTNNSDGLSQLQHNQVDFALTTAPLALPESGMVHLPFTVHPMAVVYNIPNATTFLVLSREVLVQIWTGEISSWTDPAIVNLNPSLTLPNVLITLVLKQGLSEDTGLLTATLSQLSGTWRSSMGSFSDPEPFLARPATAARVVLVDSTTTAVGVKVSVTVGSVGFMPLFAALDAEVPVAMIVNSYGKPTNPIPGPAQEAIENVTTTLPADFSLSTVDLPGLYTYPLLATVYIVFRMNSPSSSCAMMGALYDLIRWVLLDEYVNVAEQIEGFIPIPDKLGLVVLGAMANCGCEGRLLRPSAVVLHGGSSVTVGALFHTLTLEFMKFQSTTQAVITVDRASASVTGLIQGSLNFALTDTVLPRSLLQAHDLVVIPVIVNALAVVYSLSELPDGVSLVLHETDLVKIFNGAISVWNDHSITHPNPFIPLLPVPITIVVLACDDEFTLAFKQALGRFDSTWTATQDVSDQPIWPAAVRPRLVFAQSFGHVTELLR